MDLLKRTQELCRIYNIKPARSRGQSFLVNEEIYDKIIAAADLWPDDIVLEVGPGLGFLTAKLAKAAGRVVAVELDDKLAAVLRTGLKAQGIENVEIINANILDFETRNLKLETQEMQLKSRKVSSSPPDSLRDSKRAGKFQVPSFKIVANLPYNITSIFLRKFLESEIKPELMVLMLQKEVAERITAKPGGMSLLAVSVQFYAEPKLLEFVPKENFWPQPEVDSAIVKIKPHPTPLLLKERGRDEVSPPARGGVPEGRGGGGGEVEKDFFRLVKIGFSARRKMLKNNLASGFRIDQKVITEKLKTAGFSQNCRAQELSVGDWTKLLGYFS